MLRKYFRCPPPHHYRWLCYGDFGGEHLNGMHFVLVELWWQLVCDTMMGWQLKTILRLLDNCSSSFFDYFNFNFKILFLFFINWTMSHCLLSSLEFLDVALKFIHFILHINNCCFYLYHRTAVLTFPFSAEQRCRWHICFFLFL